MLEGCEPLLLQPNANPSTGIVVQKESPPSLAFAVGVAVTVRSTKDYVWKSLRSNVNGVTAVIVIRALLECR